MATYNLTAGNDVLTGTEGADTFDGVTGGTDTLDGAGGNDRFIFQNSLGPHSQGTVNGGAGTDTVVAGHLGSASYSNVEILDVTSGHVFASIAQLSSFSTITNSAEPDSRIAFNYQERAGRSTSRHV